MLKKAPRSRNFHIKEKDRILSKSSPFLYTESFKTLRTNINFISINNNYKKIVVTSSMPVEGKSCTAINLAYTMAENGNKVLLMNCDLRKPAIQEYLGIGNTVKNGLTSILSETAELNDCIYHDKNFLFDVLLSGPTPPNPAELLGSARMGALMKYLGERYDYIICDTPPASLMTDAAVLSRFCDGVLLVIKHKETTYNQVRIAKGNLESAGANIIGSVLTQFNAEKNYANKHYYGKYGYGYGYGHHHHNNPR